MHRLLVKVLQMKPEKLIRSIAEEVLEKGSKIRWLADLRKTLKELGWGNIYSTVGMELENMSEGQMMDCSVWRAVKDLFLLLQRLGVEVEQQEDIQKTASVLQVTTKEKGVARMIEKMWIKRFQCHFVLN